MRPGAADLMRITTRRLVRHTLFTLLVLAAPRAALACPVCFGQNDSPMAWGINMGIFAMLAVTGGVLAGFATFFVHLMRRARLAEKSQYVLQSSSAEAGHHRPDGQEGTAQC